MYILMIYLAAVNLLGFAIMGTDKNRSKRAERRISEKSLIFVTLIGGAIGIYCGMYTFRHKTLHMKFTVGSPLILFLQIALVILICGN